MMTNLFSIFDPSSSIEGWSVGWLMLFSFVFISVPGYWGGLNRSDAITKVILTSMGGELYPLLNTAKNIVLLPLSVFIFVLAMNIFGILPWVFVPTSHISITLAISMPVWIGILMAAVTGSFMHLMEHLVPEGTPYILMPFMVVIESVSILIRPITLSVRLGANMIAGHLLLALIGGAVDVINYFSLLWAVVGLVPLLCLESAVAVIQAYVLTVLITLYLVEV